MVVSGRSARQVRDWEGGRDRALWETVQTGGAGGVGIGMYKGSNQEKIFDTKMIVIIE
jgi:hypothetical protein